MQRVVLDTNILWDPRVLARVDPGQRTIVVPAVAFTERARQIQQAGRHVDELWHVLHANRITVENLTPEFGLRVAANLDDATWNKHARDALIAGHVGPDDVLWTKNPKDFLAVGLPADRIVAC